ncbi:hypothetical protein OAG71_00205 [bacterium]|nr:hypothetical protein [bacterium]
MRYDDWGPYVSVGERKANARSFADKLAKKQKRDRQPIEIQGRKIAKSFWGIAWCDHLESLSDVANRLPRGATYVRNGSVVDLVIQPGKVEAIVAGTDPYEITISIKKLNKKAWGNIKKDCSSAIDSLIDLLGGQLSDGVMQRLTDRKSGCFPAANQIEMECDCPDWSMCCKHLAAVMYAIGSRLDAEPELLFLLRGVNQEELINQAVSKENLTQELQADSDDLAGEDLGAIFGIELESNSEVSTTKKRRKSNSKPKLKSASRPKVANAKKKSAKKPTATNESTKSRKKTAAKKKAVAKKKAATKKKVATTKASKKKATTTRSTRKKKVSQDPATKKKSAKSSKQSTAAKKKSKAKRSAKKVIPAS